MKNANPTRFGLTALRVAARILVKNPGNCP